VSGEAKPFDDAEHRGIRWQRTADGSIRFFDPDGGRWVDWRPGVDAPPRPPGWDLAARGRPPRPGWRTRWRLIPLAVTVIVVVIAIVQVLRPSSSAVKNETSATEAMLGKCLAQHGSEGGHPRYSPATVLCSSPSASVKVVQVVPSSPGSPLCPSRTTGYEQLYPGVQYPHILCLAPVQQDGVK
jgi:hypothetical protein